MSLHTAIETIASLTVIRHVVVSGPVPGRRLPPVDIHRIARPCARGGSGGFRGLSLRGLCSRCWLLVVGRARPPSASLFPLLLLSLDEVKPLSVHLPRF